MNLSRTLSTVFNFFAVLLLCSVLLPTCGGAGIMAILFLSLLSFVRRKVPRGSLHNEVLRQLLTSDVQEALYPDNAFYASAQSDGAGIDTEVIVIPQDEDGEVETVENPSTYPLEASTEEDLRKEYAADLLVTLPKIITWNNQRLLVYDKRANKIRKHTNSLDTQTADKIMYGWAPTVANFVYPTSGTPRPARAPGATGNRLRATDGDFQRIMTEFNALDIPVAGRRCVVNPYLYEDILQIKKDYGSGTDENNRLLETGAVAYIHTFNVYLRSRTTVFTGDGVKKPRLAMADANDRLSGIFWHPNFVRYVKGTVEVNMDPYNKPELAGGRSMNALVRGGGTTSRLSERGVAAMAEAIA